VKDKPSEEFERFDKVMKKILSVSKKELDRRLAEAKKNKIGKRYPKPKDPTDCP
jgi:DNA-binding HxlR family transcriptional regulator